MTVKNIKECYASGLPAKMSFLTDDPKDEPGEKVVKRHILTREHGRGSAAGMYG